MWVAGVLHNKDHIYVSGLSIWLQFFLTHRMLPSPAPSVTCCPFILGNCWNTPDSSALLPASHFSPLSWFCTWPAAFLGRYPTTLESLTQSRFYLHSFIQWPLWASMQDTYLASIAFLDCQGRLHNLSLSFFF